MNFRSPRGFPDLSAEQLEKEEYIKKLIFDVSLKYGFQFIETSPVENIRVLQNASIAGNNEKLIFKILKRKYSSSKVDSLENDIFPCDLGLRYDLTLPLMRYYLANKSKLPKILKSFQFGYVWRAERPQRGRFRQFKQCDLDILGIRDISAEATLLYLLVEVLTGLNLLGRVKIVLNDIRIVKKILSFCNFKTEHHNKIFIIIDKIRKIGYDNVLKEIRTLFSYANLDKFEHLLKFSFTSNWWDILFRNSVLATSDSFLHSFRDLFNSLTLIFKDIFCFYPFLCRGMGYYTGIVFEVETLERRSSIIAGGRYDCLLAKKLGSSENIFACGLSFGIIRIIDNLVISLRNKISVKKVAVISETTAPEVIFHIFNLIKNFSNEKYSVSFYNCELNTRNFLEKLRENNFSYYYIVRTSSVLEQEIKVENFRKVKKIS